MDKHFAIYLTKLICEDIESRTNCCMSSSECELIEANLANNNFTLVDDFIKRKIKNNKTVSEIVGETSEN